LLFEQVYSVSLCTPAGVCIYVQSCCHCEVPLAAAVGRKLGLRFRSEFFNIFNHPNFGNPNNMLTSPLFGYSTQTLANSLASGGANGGFNPLYQIGGPRSIQLALKLQL